MATMTAPKFAKWTAGKLTTEDQNLLHADLTAMLGGGRPSPGRLPGAGFQVFPRWDMNGETVARASLFTAAGDLVARLVA